MKKFNFVFYLFISLLMSSCGKEITTSSISSSTISTSIESEEISFMYLKVNNNTYEIILEKNSSVDNLCNILKNTDITFTVDDYGGFEKVGSFGYNISQNNQSIVTTPGDVILYEGDKICFYYGTNSWSFTKLGKIVNATESEIKELLNANKGSIEVTLTLIK